MALHEPLGLLALAPGQAAVVIAIEARQQQLPQRRRQAPLPIAGPGVAAGSVARPARAGGVVGACRAHRAAGRGERRRRLRRGGAAEEGGEQEGEREGGEAGHAVPTRRAPGRLGPRVVITGDAPGAVGAIGRDHWHGADSGPGATTVGVPVRT